MTINSSLGISHENNPAKIFLKMEFYVICVCVLFTHGLVRLQLYYTLWWETPHSFIYNAKILRNFLDPAMLLIIFFVFEQIKCHKPPETLIFIEFPRCLSLIIYCDIYYPNDFTPLKGMVKAPFPLPFCSCHEIMCIEELSWFVPSCPAPAPVTVISAAYAPQSQLLRQKQLKVVEPSDWSLPHLLISNSRRKNICSPEPVLLLMQCFDA